MFYKKTVVIPISSQILKRKTNAIVIYVFHNLRQNHKFYAVF